MIDNPEVVQHDSQSATLLPPSSASLCQKCLTCDDLGQSCRGFDITIFEKTDDARSYHKSLRKLRNIPLRAIYELLDKKIGESTINEYFGSGSKDYKWFTVVNIHNALLVLCGKRRGLPPLDHSCSSSSSEIRQQMADAERNLLEADIKYSQVLSDFETIKQKLTETKGKHITQMSTIQENHEKNMEWMRNDVVMWRRFALQLLAIGTILLACLAFSVVWIITHTMALP